ncbi:MAG: succinoglycan biosynthesis protein ExoM [Frankiales bacterium]|nr:succinoglycan biosynthesis protein ExoM [Frankiales bacterium]
MTSPGPQVSVVVPTYRRPSLARTLGGLARQHLDVPFEVVIVDNDAAGSARPVVDEHASAIAGEVRHIVESQAGSAYARNRGIAAARAPVIAFLDDDVEPQPGWLSAITAPIRSRAAEATGGRVVLDPTVPRPNWFDEMGIGGYLTSFHLDDDARELIGREFVVTANAAFDTDLLRRSGGFVPALGPRGTVQLVGDDVHVVRAVQRLGARVRYVPDAVVVHELPATRLRPVWMLKRAWWQGRSDWILNADDLHDRKFGGAAVAVDWYTRELRRRRGDAKADRISTRAVLFHALCDTARTAGSLVGAARLARMARSDDEELADTVDRWGAGGIKGDKHDDTV